MIDIISNWQTIVSIGALLITVGGLIFMNRDYSKRILKIEEWKERIVDGKLSDIEKKIDIIIEVQKGKDDLLAEKLKNILEKIDNKNCEDLKNK